MSARTPSRQPDGSMTPAGIATSADAQPDDAEPSVERQATLCAAYEANVAAGRPPYANTRLHTRGEVAWVLREQGWSGEYDAYTVKYVLTPKGAATQPADLRGVNLGHVCLRDIFLRRADLSGANLVFADLRGAHLADATLADAHLGRIRLRQAELHYAPLTRAHLRG